LGAERVDVHEGGKVFSAEPRSQEVMCETLYRRRGARHIVLRAYKSVVRAEGMKRPGPRSLPSGKFSKALEKKKKKANPQRSPP
jgi:hypothetical protein